MIRRILDFVFLLLFVWACMILGLWIISSFIVPLELPGMKSGIVIAVFRLAISAAMTLFWLWLWREIIKRMFWRSMKTQQHIINEPSDNIRGKEMAKEDKPPESC
jgi:hypothetical protein